MTVLRIRCKKRRSWKHIAGVPHAGPAGQGQPGQTWAEGFI